MKTYADIGKYENGLEKGFHNLKGLHYVSRGLDTYYIDKKTYDSINNEQDCMRIIAQALINKARFYAPDVHLST